MRTTRLMVFAALATLAACGGSSETQIEATVIRDILGNGSFTAESDDVCAAGTLQTLRWEPTSGADGERTFWRIQLTCDDGSGVFTLDSELDVSWDAANGDEPVNVSGVWTASSGLGDYRDISATGEFSLGLTAETAELSGTLDID